MESEKDSFMFLFASTIKAMFKQSTKLFELHEVGISPEQNYLLSILSSQEESIQSELAEILQKDKSAVMRHIDSLETMGMVVRVSDTIDRRKKHIVITEKGLEVKKRCQELMEESTLRNQKGIPAEEIAIFKKVLMKMRDNASS
ncbi:DNA-binding transcriptional regulator, MarR family [Pseudarcicella hirudinis]|uniref:DNA-binding transcriptional regulator, MarR family n=1 Tax=Pseudarcicella hirudinis TaxID=1079859 RepID=A0A1I5RKI0_9BACT|nr:MarR family transcriptional regulator [Pseudarcicella hirudinis]SFP58890.1 DNA-binding transcriptional regulator, MarR family [Pseudarcicella hirudinis]